MSKIRIYKDIFEIIIQVFERHQPIATKKGAKARMRCKIIMNFSWQKATNKKYFIFGLREFPKTL